MILFLAFFTHAFVLAKAATNHDSLLVTTESFWNDMARFITKNEGATFDSTVSVSLEQLFSCVDNGQALGNRLADSQNGAWSGMVQYARTYNNEIRLRAGVQVTTIDEWGGRCFPDTGNPDTLECVEPNTSPGWLECLEEDTCQPEILQASLTGENTVLDMEIYEPCNTLSNLAYYRTLPELCAVGNLFGDATTQTALGHGMAAMGFASSFFHSSITYLGGIADVSMIDVVALIIHQVMVGALQEATTAANPTLVEPLDRLFHLQHAPRSRTAVESALQMTAMFRDADVTEWTSTILYDLDVPEFRVSFTALAATALAILFPDRPELSAGISEAMVTLLDGSPQTLEYLPSIQAAASNVVISDNERFILMRQFAGTVLKLLYSFLWQEKTLQLDIFLQDGPNRIGADIMPVLMSLFNFISGFDHADEAFQNGQGVYPGDEQCRLQPHAKWHEVSASGLLDLAFTADCFRTVVTGKGLQCATLSGSGGLDSIALDDVRAWVYAQFPQGDNNFFIGASFEIAILAVFLPLDKNFDGKIDYGDIQRVVDDVVDWVEFIQDAFDWWDGFMTDLNSIVETARCILDPVCIGDTIDACLTDSMCAGNEQCVMLSCGLQQIGEACLFDTDCAGGACGLFTCGLQAHGAPCVLESDCASGRCEWDTFTCQAKVGLGSTCNEDNDCASNVCTGGHGIITGVCGKQPDGAECLEDSDCQSGRCEGYVWETWTCYPKVSNGGGCNEDSDCTSGRCEGWYGFAKCRARQGRGASCNESSDCISNRCNTNWWGSGKCT